MTSADDPLRQHLQHWLLAYGADLAIPPGQARAPAQPAAGAETEPEPGPVVAEEPLPELELPEPTAQPVVPPRPAVAPPAPDDEGSLPGSPDALRALRDEVLPCTKCKLHKSRQNTVFGEGSPTARVMFVGEAPGAREDQTGRPFVGPAGQLLDRILKGAMGLEREQVFIANINKCRPPGNRAPEADEVAACLPFLREQVAIIQPEVIVCLGRTAAQNLLGTTASTRALRGKEHEYAGIPVIVTWHPAYLLRDPSHKRETWDDIKRVNKLLGLPETPGQQG